MPEQRLLPVVENTELTDNICLIKIKTDDVFKDAVPGQFVHVRCGDANLLRRPISICDVQNGILTIVVEARGDGTKWLSERHAGDLLDILGPLGNGFEISGQNIILVGGGIGVPPMLYAARRCTGDVTAVLGFRNSRCVILKNAFDAVCRKVIAATDDGSYGEHGTISLPLEGLLKTGKYDAVLACGPRAMLKAAAALCQTYQVPCQVSMEERMGCGIGACLVCACKTQKDGKEEMRHVCKDGPVFDGSEVVW